MTDTKQKQQGDLTIKQKQGNLTINKQKSRQGGASEIAAFVQRTQALQVATRPQQGRLIFALDATASRQETWDAACEIQAEMFNEVTGLNVQLVYFRGHKECRASGWVASGDRLAGLMQRIRCSSGATQIGKVLSHARTETDKNKVAALVFVGDAMEEGRDDLAVIARELGARGLPVFMFQEGDYPEVEQAYREIARLTHGAYCRFDGNASHQLAELLRAVAAYASGGVKALEAKAGAAKLIEQLIRR
jgi:hypothetical protein